VPKKRKRAIKVIARVILISTVLVACYFLVKPLAKIDYKIATLLRESERLDWKIEALEDDVATHENEINFKNTKSGIEYFARKELHMIYPGETLYVCKDSSGYTLSSPIELNLDRSPKTNRKNPISIVWDWFLSLFR